MGVCVYVLQGVVGETPAGMLKGVYEGQTGGAPGCSKTVVQTGQTGLANRTNRERKEGWDKRARIAMKKKRSK